MEMIDVALVAAKHVDEILRLREDGMSWRKIEAKLNIGRGAINRALKAAGHPPSSSTPPHVWTEEEIAKLIACRNPLFNDNGEMIRPGMTGKELFAEFPDIADCVVQRRLYILRNDPNVDLR